MIELFNRGGFFMWPILGLLILGLAVSFERFISLTRAAIDTRKFMTELHHALTTGGIEAAKAVCHQVHAPLASIFHAGLMRTDKGLDVVEKTIINAGSIEMAFLERGLVWLATVISLAPMLGFTGTVQGMVNAFDAIAAANDISPAIVAEGISIALLTTLFGLVVAIIIQVFHNYFIAKIDRIVIAMEESAAEFLDLLIDYEDGKK